MRDAAINLRARPEQRELIDQAAQPTPPEKQRMREQHGTCAQYGWSEDKARQYSVPERHSFGPYIRAQGFALK